MVRVLACHHFQGQQIGRCDEAVALTLAEHVIIIALENKVNIYSSLKTLNLQEWFRNQRQSLHFGTGEFGNFFSFAANADSNKADAPRNEVNEDFLDDLVLFHSFAPVDVIKTINYNLRGHYLLSLEKHDFGTTSTYSHSVRTYFQWDQKTEGRPMRARVAGLVSPTGGEEDGSLKMIEIPPAPLFATRAVASCTLTGNIASLSSDARVNIYAFKVKEGSGRNKAQYADFDLQTTVQLSCSNFSPDHISFTLDFISCSNSIQVSVFRIVSNELSEADISRKKPGFSMFNQYKISSDTPSEISGSHRSQDIQTDTVVFDPKIDSVKVYLRTISKSNRKSKQPNFFCSEEYQEDILNKSSIMYSHPKLESGFLVEDLLRISLRGCVAVAESSNNDFIQVELYPIRVKDAVGGAACIVGTSKEVFIYNLPIKRCLLVTRISSHPFTSNLISFSFDTLFLHAITESGLETYTLRNLYFPLKEAEGFQVYENDCPLQDELPVLVGIRPFLGVRFMAANKHRMCLLSSPVPAGFSPNSSGSATISNEETLWTIYSLLLPNMNLLYQDILKAAQLHQERSPESYFILLCELHILLRTTINNNPESEPVFRTKYLEICRLIGFEYFRKSTKEDSTPFAQESDELINKGVTYLRMANCDLQYIFSPENSKLTKDPALISGIVRFIRVTLPGATVDPDSRLSPTLSKVIVEFLSNHSSEALVDLVLDVSWLRECNSSRLIQILEPLADTQDYRSDEALALLLSIVAHHGDDSSGRRRVKEVLSKCRSQELEPKFQLSWLLCTRNKQYSVSEFTVCLSAANNTHVHINVLSGALKSGEVSLSDVVVAFAQGVNLNSDIEIQQSLSKSLSSILENYFVDKLKLNSSEMPGNCTPEEIRALHTLVRSYLTNISTNNDTLSQKSDSDKIKTQTTKVLQSGELGEQEINSMTTDGTEKVGLKCDEKIEQQWQLFGNIPSFTSLIVSDLLVDENCLTRNASAFTSLESKENFVKLISILGSQLSLIEGVRELSLTSLKQANQVNSQVYMCVELLCETCDTAIERLMTKHPTLLMVYAKEIFGKSTKSWKTVVSKLKEKINAQASGVECFTTIIESVYLHLANILSPTELEEVLDKEEENAKFYSACRRVDLANTIKQKVVKTSTMYLDQAK